MEVSPSKFFKLHYISDIECSEAFVYLTFIYIL